MSTYTIQQNDTLSAIAQSHGLSLACLEASNPGVNADLLQIGQTLHMPPPDVTPVITMATATTGLNADMLQALAIQNAARHDATAQQNHPRADLVWDTNLAGHAQFYANKMAASGQFEHSGAPGMGENLYAGIGGPVDKSLTAAAQDWVNEKANYQGQPIGQGNFEGYGHYTQCVWPTTTHAGMAMATGANGWTYVVGRYTAQGNVVGQSAW